MYSYLAEKSKEEKNKCKETELSGVVKTISSKQRHCIYAGLCGQIRSILDVKERVAKSYIRFMRDREIIWKAVDNVGCFILGCINC
jgi:hypothetical protein